MKPVHPTSGRFAHLDSLRGAAALLVLWMHGGMVLTRGETDGLVAVLCSGVPEFLHFGRVGVVIFFALSGYLIAGSLEESDWRTSFPIKRIFRLYPIYLFSMGAVLVLIDAHWDVPTILANLTMLPTFLGRAEMMGLYWTLQTEVVFYLIIYLAAFLGLGRSRLGLLILSVFFTLLYIASLLFLGEDTLDSLPLLIEKLPQHLGIMFWGAYLHKRKHEELWGWIPLALTGLILIPPAVAVADIFAQGWNGPPPVLTAYITAVLSAYLVFIFRGSNRVLAWLGRISYSAYLNHAFVLILFVRFGLDLGVVPGMALYLAVTVVVSAVTYRWIEAPAIRFSKKLAGRLRTE